MSNTFLQYLVLQNDEKYFRQFIAGFVGIWEDKININFDKNAALWNQIKSNGPALQVRRIMIFHFCLLIKIYILHKNYQFRNIYAFVYFYSDFRRSCYRQLKNFSLYREMTSKM